VCGVFTLLTQAGTGVARPEDQDPSKGRILVLTYAEGKVG
jgi:hypothetical protein